MRRSWRYLAAIAAVGLLALAPSTPTARAGDWTHWRGPQQNGVSPETGLPARWSPDPRDADGNLVWKAPFGCRSTPLVMDGRVYLINYSAQKVKEGEAEREVAETIQERVMCLDADSGKVLWQHKFNVFHTDIVTVRLGWTNLAADPATGKIYAHGTQGLLICFDRDGQVQWQRSLTEEFGRITGYGGRVTSPIVADGLVVIGMLNSSWGDQGKGGCRFVALNKADGKIVWWSEPGGQPKDTFYSVPVVAEIDGQKLLISGGADGGVYAMKLNTGERVWTYYFGSGGINCSPVVEGSMVYIGHGEENPDNAVQGRVICLDASKVEDGKPALVWEKDGIKARYASPILHEGKLYVPDDIGKLYCLDAKSGKQLWKYNYGLNSRGSPVLADGKIYVGEVNSKFHILGLTDRKPEPLHEHFFPSSDGVSDVELNGSPAVANGRVYFSTSDEIFCIGKKETVKSSPLETKASPAREGGTLHHVQIVPADVTLHPGDSVEFNVRLFDEKGNLGKVTGAKFEWSLPTPPLPPGAKAPPPALKGKLDQGKLTVAKDLPAQQGYVSVKLGQLEGKARVRVAPRLPYAQDFTKVPEGAVPSGWVNTQGKFLVKILDGEKVLAKVNDKASPLIARGHAFITTPATKDYTIECDVQGTQVGDEKTGVDMPEVGVGAQRYTLFLAGNVQRLRLMSWDALPRIDRSVPFGFKAGEWYRLKLQVDPKGLVRGKAWPRGGSEPEEWNISLTDSTPNTEGAATLYGYVTGNTNRPKGTEIYYDNLRITPNSK